MSHLLVIGGSDAGISASLRARELDPSTDMTMVYTPPFSSPWDPVQMAAQDWVAAWRAPQGSR